MQTHTIRNAPSAAMSYEITERLRIGIYLSSCELLTYLVLSLLPKQWLPIVLIGITNIVTLSMPRLFRTSKLAVDIRDLCLFDVGAAILGYALVILGYESYLFFLIGCAIFTMKMMRLCWPVKTADGDAYAGWPVFGLFSYRFARQQTKNDPAFRLFTWDRNTQLAYLCMALSFPIGAVLAEYKMLQLALWAVVPLTYQIISAVQMIGDVTAMRSESEELRKIKAEFAAYKKAHPAIQPNTPLKEDAKELLALFDQADLLERWRVIEFTRFFIKRLPRTPPDAE